MLPYLETSLIDISFEVTSCSLQSEKHFLQISIQILIKYSAIKKIKSFFYECVENK